MLFAIVLGSVFVPATVLAVPLFLMLSQSGLSKTLLAVILPALVNPFGVYLMRIFAERSIPEELLDAARVDGAGEFRIFWTISFRLLAPGFVTVLLFAFVGAWNNYFLPLLVLSKSELFHGHRRPLQLERARGAARRGAGDLRAGGDRLGDRDPAGDGGLPLPAALLAGGVEVGQRARLSGPRRRAPASGLDCGRDTTLSISPGGCLHRPPHAWQPAGRVR